jgi:hypothetical protein
MNEKPCIFNENEIVIQQETAKMKAYAKPFSQWSKSAQFFSINSLKHIGDNRKSENVSIMKNFLFEFDTLPLDEQKTLLKKRRDIISMAVYSGNKSIHFILQVVDTPETREQYHYVWELLANKYFPLADKQCKDVLRLSRTPNSARSDTGKRQILILNELQPLSLNWRPLYQKIKELKDMSASYRRTITIRRNGALDYEAECILKGEYPKGERDEIIRVGVPYLFHHGYLLDEILENNMNERSNPQTIKNYYNKLASGYYGQSV